MFIFSATLCFKDCTSDNTEEIKTAKDVQEEST